MIKFYSDNQIDDAIVTASTTNAQYPASNLQHDFRTKVWRSTSNSDNVVFDLGGIEDINSFCFVPNWQSGFGFSTISIQGNATDSWGSPAYDSGSITFDVTHGFGKHDFPTTQSYRYWRVVMTSTLGYCELSNVFIGKSVDITTNGINYNWAYTNKDLKGQKSTRYGQEYIDTITQRKELTGLSMRVVNTTELDQLFEVFDNRQTTRPLFIQFCDDTNALINDVDRLNGQYKIISEPKVTNTTVGLWSTSFGLREQM